MKFDLRRLRRDQTAHVAERLAPADAGVAAEDFQLAAPVEFEADLRKDAAKVRVTGRVRAVLDVPCSRCLEPFQVPVDAPFDLMFLPATENAGGGEQEIDEDDVGVSYYRDDEIDLTDVMREQLYLALPMKPLCREDCQGLCPVCGVNRNRETCACRTDWVDPRMASLKKLLEG